MIIKGITLSPRELNKLSVELLQYLLDSRKVSKEELINEFKDKYNDTHTASNASRH